MFRKIALAALLGTSALVPVATGASASTPSFGLISTLAQPLNFGDNANAQSTSCPSSGHCTAAGYFYDVNEHSQAFVADQSSGVWHGAIEIGAAFNIGHYASLESVSCSSAGNCVAGGFFSDALSHQQAMVLSEHDGHWGDPVNVTATMNISGQADMYRVSCATDASCVAVGWVGVGANEYQSVIMEKKNGLWGAPFEVATVLNAQKYGYLQTVSCPTAGNCSAGGVYTDAQGNSQVFAISQVNGFWGSPLTLLAGLNTGGSAFPNQISCSTNANCSMVGSFSQDPTGVSQGFGIDEVNGQWKSPHDLTSTVNLGGRAAANSVSCTSPGNCVSGGYFSNLLAPHVISSHRGPASLARLLHPREQSNISHEAFIAVESHGVWANSTRVAHALNVGMDAQVTSLSCVDASNCLVGGYYRDRMTFRQVFALTEVAGVWHDATELLGVQNIGGNAEAVTTACSLSGYCVLGGYYGDTLLDPQAFVISKQFASAQIIIDPFAEGSSARNATIDAQILAAAALIKSHALHVVSVIGHTDSLDTHQFNLDLGLRRARVVKKQLLSDLKALGYGALHVHTATQGDTQFVANNSTPSGRALNRRVVITL